MSIDENNLQDLISLYNDSELVEKLFLLIKDNVKYKFGDWRRNPNDTIKIGHGMCTTKSRALFEILKSLGFEVYYFKLKINARKVFGKFTFPKMRKYISENSVHFYLGVRLEDKLIKLDPSIDRMLEEKIGFFGYKYDKDWNISKDYTNFIESKYIISIERINNIDDYLNRRITLVNRFKFYISNVFLDYLREYNHKSELEIFNKNIFLKWLYHKNFFKYLIFKLLLI